MENSQGWGLRSRAKHSGRVPYTREQIESALYDPTYAWQVEPGTDVPASSVGPLTLVGTSADGSYSYYAGVVTLAPHSNIRPLVVDHSPWGVMPLDTPMTFEAIDAAPWNIGTSPGVPTAYLAGFYHDNDIPFELPEGWTLGNSTGTDAVLPYLGEVPFSGNNVKIWAGPVDVPAGDASAQSTTHGAYQLLPIDTPLHADWIWDYLQTVGVPLTVPAGTYLAVATLGDVFDDGPPTTLPEGWTVRRPDIGQIATTDENACVVIGSIAYIISGWVYNTLEPAFMKAMHGRLWRGPIRPGLEWNVKKGEYFATLDSLRSPSAPALFTSDGTVAWDGNAVTGTAGHVDFHDPRYWPYIERYDFATGQRLPRIPLPKVPITWVDRGAWDPDTAYTGAGESPESVTKGGVRYWARPGAGIGPGVDPTAFHSSSDSWTDVEPDYDYVFMAEAGIAGVIDGKIYFGGGDGPSVQGYEFFVFDPEDESFTRLEDMNHDDYPDYTPYGTVAGKLWYFSGSTAYSYTPGTGWESHEMDNPCTGFGDQIVGFPIDGKLWFVKDSKAAVFDPVAMTWTAKSQTGSGNGLVAVWQHKIVQFGQQDFGGPRAYDPATDTWTTVTTLVTEPPTGGGGELAQATFNDVPYLLSHFRGIGGLEQDKRGIVALRYVGLDRPRSARAQDTKADSLYLPKVDAERHGRMLRLIQDSGDFPIAALPVGYDGLVTFTVPMGAQAYRLELQLGPDPALQLTGAGGDVGADMFIYVGKCREPGGTLDGTEQTMYYNTAWAGDWDGNPFPSAASTPGSQFRSGELERVVKFTVAGVNGFTIAGDKETFTPPAGGLYLFQINIGQWHAS